MRKQPIAFILILAFSGFACHSPIDSQGPSVVTRPDWKYYFDQRGVEGTFVIYSQKGNEYFICNESRACEQYLPASTFKIINSLIALETGVMKNPSDTLQWDGKKHEIESWNRDQDMLHAFKNSTVWFYQELARRAGEENMKRWVSACGYGNMDISGGIDLFWLNGAIRISAMEQVSFLNKLAQDQLPFKKENQALVREMMLTEEMQAYRIFGKTGWAARVSPQTGWFVGFVEKDGEYWVFAMNMEIPENSQINERIPITREILGDFFQISSQADP